MARKKLLPIPNEPELIKHIGNCFNDPLLFCTTMFRWGEGELKGDKLDNWQRDFLKNVTERLKSGEKKPLKFSVCSGNGVGKSALVSMLILWAMSTRPHLSGLITANTMTQLVSKTWRELSIWHKRVVNRDWFTWTATKFYHKQHPENWFCSAIAWSKERPEAFAGTHSKYVLQIFDEASSIDDSIWDAGEQGMTTSDAMWFVFGNPTRSSGRFKQCFNEQKHRWINAKVDSRDARMTDKVLLQNWIEDYGEDSDFCRVRIKGEFPRTGAEQLISSEDVEIAMKKIAQNCDYKHSPKIIGVDVARFGDDQTVIAKRQGLLCHELMKYRGLDTMQVANIVANEIASYNPDAVFIDSGNMGAGVVDRLNQLGFNVIGIDFGATASFKERYANKRSEMWCLLRDWIMRGGKLPDDKELFNELVTPTYGFSGDKGAIQLEKKKDIKSRGGTSPDCADAIALTFAMPVKVGVNPSMTKLHNIKRRSL